MYLRRLEITGFKSFPERTVLEFSPGLTAIVGPNGSGKSNLADAVRWVLGGQSPRLLRTSRMDEVIFSGTDQRKPLNLARVRLTLDNSDQTLPVPFSEVQITRELSRDGESSYQLNGSSCRLKDIQYLLAGTGLGRDAYSLIGQGRVEEMINAHGEERRGLLEEAAGITRYRQQRQDTLRRLEASQRDLQRLHDIIAELQSQLGPLREQADRACQYRVLMERLRTHECDALLIERATALRQLERGQREHERRRSEWEHSHTELTGLRQLLTQRRHELEELQGGSRTVEVALNQEALEERALVVRQEACASALEAMAGEIELLARRLAVLEELESARREDERECAAARDQLEEELARAESVYQEGQARVAQLRERLAQLEAQVEDAKARAIDTLNVAAAQRNQLRAQELEQSHVRQLHSRLEQESHALRLSQERWVAERERLRREMEESRQQTTALRQELEDQSGHSRALERRLAELRGHKESVQASVDRAQSRLTVVREMLNSYEGYARGPRQLLQEAAKLPNLRGVLGSVAELLTVEDDYQLAIEAALGGALQYIITETDDVATACIAHLKSRNAGRATFLPLNLVKPFHLHPREKQILQQSPGARSALSVVSFAEHLTPALQHLLGRVLIAYDLQQALSMGRQTGLRSRIATLAGELLAPGGVLSGGGRPGGTISLLGRKREAGELSARLERERAQLSQLQREEQDANRELTELNSWLQAAYRKLAGLEAREQGLGNEGVAHRTEGERLAGAQAASASELASLREQLTVLETGMSEVAASAAQLEAVATQVRNAAQEQSEDHQRQKMAYEQVTEQVADLRVKVAELTEAKLLREERVARAAHDLQAAQRELTEHRDRQRMFIERRMEKESELVLVRERHGGHAARRQELEAALRNTLDRQATVRDSLRQAEEQTLDWERKQRSLENRLHAVELENARWELQLNHILEQLRERFGVDPAELPAEASQPKGAGSANIASLRGEIAALGEVNLGSINEYERLAERHDFLQQQKQDVETASRDLERVIAETDKQIEGMFTVTLQAVRTSFQSVFRRLFGGGTADLVMGDAQHPLESGVEVVVQPPGRKLRNMNLLSGGEKALTAIALLFALLKIRPSPFCFLDEIEAALDDHNAQRFLQLLAEFAPRTQFILITHHKVTMEAADVLYGVTMQETGISRLISINLVDAAQGQS